MNRIEDNLGDLTDSVLKKLAHGGLNDIEFLRRGEQSPDHASALLICTGLEAGQVSDTQTYLVSPWVVSPRGKELLFPGEVRCWKVVGPSAPGLKRQLDLFDQPVDEITLEQLEALLQCRAAIWISLLYGVGATGSTLQRFVTAQLLQSEWRALHQYLFNASVLLSTAKQFVSLPLFWAAFSELSNCSVRNLILPDESIIALLVGEAIRKKQSLGQDTRHLQMLYDDWFT